MGGILIPLLTWFLLYRIQKRIRNNSTVSKFPVNILYAFIAALSFGLLLSVFFTLGYSEIPFYMIVSLLVLAIFLPIYKAECFLGFVLGMTFTLVGVSGIYRFLAVSGFALINRSLTELHILSHQKLKKENLSECDTDYGFSSILGIFSGGRAVSREPLNSVTDKRIKKWEDLTIDDNNNSIVRRSNACIDFTN
jgi:prepilin signal peptidase PulO-like enzyme (type II secretory pathway)